MKFICVALIAFYNFTTSSSGQFKVVGPSFPLIAVPGEDLILPCSLQPNISAEEMTVKWFRLETDSTVHLYTRHDDKSKDQAVSYRGRTALFKEELQKGNTSLKLSEVQVSDDGNYKCFVRSDTWYDDVTLTLVVEATGRDPVITVEEHVLSGGIRLVCESKGWNPEPEIEWLDSEGAALAAEATEKHKDSEGFTVRRCVTVYNSDSNRFYCRVKFGDHLKQTEVIISDKTFLSWRISIIFNFLLLLLLLMGLTGLLTRAQWRQRRIRHMIEKNRVHRVDVIMDAKTAHPYLNFSDNGKEVTYGKKRDGFCEGAGNFDDAVFVLGNEGFQRSFYFEVQVRGKTHWTIGVAIGSIRRKGDIVLKPEYGFWTLRKKNNKYTPSHTISLRRNIKKVGVFVDYEEGVVSFYDVNAMSLIYSFEDQSFSEKLYPILSPGLKHGGKNGAPLVITDVPKSHLNTAAIAEQSATNVNNVALLATEKQSFYSLPVESARSRCSCFTH